MILGAIYIGNKRHRVVVGGEVNYFTIQPIRFENMPFGVFQVDVLQNQSAQNGFNTGSLRFYGANENVITTTKGQWSLAGTILTFTPNNGIGGAIQSISLLADDNEGNTSPPINVSLSYVPVIEEPVEPVEPEPTSEYTYEIGLSGIDASILQPFARLGFTISETLSANGINIIADANKQGRTFSIDANSERINLLCQNDKGAVLTAIKYALSKLNFHFLGVSERWWIKPAKLVAFSQSETISIDVPYHGFFGTGGNGWDAITKNQLSFYNDYLGNYHEIDFSHSLTNFYKKNKEEIDRLQANGYSIMRDYSIAKNPKNINEDEPEALRILCEWIEKKYFDFPDKFTFSVSPADGIGDGQGKDSANPLIVNSGTKYLWLANEVAKYMNVKYQDFADRCYITYAVYGSGTGVCLPPVNLNGWDIQPNLWFQLITAFQRDYSSDANATALEKMQEDWLALLPNHRYSTYLYWCLTQWFNGVPQNGLHEKVIRELNSISNFISVNVESTHHSIRVNPYIYALSNVVSGTDPVDAINGYFEQFPSIGQQLKNLYAVVFNNWAGESSLPVYLHEVAEMYDTATTDFEKDILVELMADAIFLKKYYKSKGDKTVENALDGERWAKYVQSLTVIQAWTVWKVNYTKWKAYGGGKSPDEWNDYRDELPFDMIKPVIIETFNKAVAENTVLFEPVPFIRDVRRTNMAAGDRVGELFYRSKYKDSTFDFHVTTQKQLTFSANFTEAGQKCEITDNEFMNFTYEASGAGQLSFTPDLEFQPGKIYYITFNQKTKYDLIDNIILPESEANFFAVPIIYGTQGKSYNSWYLYMPINTAYQNLILRVNEKYTSFKVYDQNGLLREPPKDANGNYISIYHQTFAIPVSPSDKGQLWKIEASHPNWKMVNFEPLLSRTKFDYNE